MESERSDSSDTMQSQERTDTSARCCYICLGTEDPTATQGQGQSEGWVSPCKCIGSTRWVHARCVRRWVREVEYTKLGRPACPLCLTPYTLLPTLGPVVRALNYWNRHVYAGIRVGVGHVVYTSIYNVTCASLGGLATCVVCGREEITALLTSDITLGFAVMYWIGLGLVSLSLLPWEDFILWGLRKASRLPLLGTVLPEEAPPGYGAHRILRSIPVAVKEAALLPFCSKVVGELLFSAVKSIVTRALVGGLAFLLVKGGLIMFYRQKLMIRHKTMAIVPLVQSQARPDE